MSAHAQLLLVLVIVYLSDCYVWFRRSAWAFVSWTNVGWSARRPRPLFSAGQGGIVLLNPLPPGAYTLFITLKNTPSPGAPQRSFEQQPMILVEDASSPISFWPKVTLYRDSGYTVEWGNRSSPFKVASSDSLRNCMNSISGAKSASLTRVSWLKLSA